MLDVLAELLIELFQGKDPKKTAQQKRPQNRPPPATPQRADNWPQPSADDPYVKDHPSDAQNPGQTPGLMSVEDLMRQMYEKARQGGADAPVLDPDFHKSPPPAPRRKPPPQAQRRVRTPKPARPEPEPAREEPLAAPAPVPAVPPGPRTVDVRPAADPAVSGPDFAARLRNNPDAAREAFVFSEIFGRPLGERM